jgi:hypothetical protein
VKDLGPACDKLFVGRAADLQSLGEQAGKANH